MNEIAESQLKKQDALNLQAPTDGKGHPAREWIDTLLQAAVIAKDKQKKTEEDQASTNSMTLDPSTTAAIVEFSTTNETDAVVTTMNEGINNFKDNTKYLTPPGADDTLTVPNHAVVKPEREASTPAPKRYRRRRCEVEGCAKFARFNNACSGHGGRRLCAEAGCERVAQFGHKCSAHGGVKLCSVEGCHRAVQSRGCCKTHGGGVRCQHPDCTKGAISKGFCRSHGGGSRCAELDCFKWAQRLGYCVRHSKSTPSPNAVVPASQLTATL